MTLWVGLQPDARVVDAAKIVGLKADPQVERSWVGLQPDARVVDAAKIVGLKADPQVERSWVGLQPDIVCDMKGVALKSGLRMSA